MIYLVSRTDHVGYDEHDAFVVVAHSALHALLQARHRGGSGLFRDDNTTVEVIDPEKFGVILGSFNAG